MFRKGWRTAFVLLVLLVVSATPSYAPQWFNEHIYYYDYFVTELGGHGVDCSGSYYAWGDITNANFKTQEVGNCNGPFYSFTCWQRADTQWVQISCP